MGNSWIIIVIAAAWWIIQMIVQAAAKKQEQQRLKELAEQRRKAAQQGGTPTTQRATSLSQTSQQTASRSTSREELAARRQAQLEELRRRRAAQTQRSATNVRTGSGKPSLQSPPTTRKQITTLSPQLTKTKPVPNRARQTPSRQPTPEASALAAAQVLRTAMQAYEQPTRSSRKKLDDESKRLRRAAESLPAPTLPPTSTLRAKLHNRQALRELIVLKELLDKPLAMRSADQSLWAGG